MLPNYSSLQLKSFNASQPGGRVIFIMKQLCGGVSHLSLGLE